MAEPQGYTMFGRWLVRRGPITRAVFWSAMLPWYFVAGAALSLGESWREWAYDVGMMRRDAARLATQGDDQP